MDGVVKVLCTKICEKLIDLGIIKSWYCNGSFIIRYAKREFVLTLIERKGGK